MERRDLFRLTAAGLVGVAVADGKHDFPAEAQETRQESNDPGQSINLGDDERHLTHARRPALCPALGGQNAYHSRFP
jgi:hypothetical protein